MPYQTTGSSAVRCMHHTEVSSDSERYKSPLWSQTSLVPMVSSQLALSTPWHQCGIVMAEEAKLLEQVTRLEAPWLLLTWIEPLEASSLEKPVLVSGPSVSGHCWTMSCSVNYILEMPWQDFYFCQCVLVLYSLLGCGIVLKPNSDLALDNYFLLLLYIYIKISSIIHIFRS